MGSLAGWQGSVRDGSGTLRGMIEPMAGPRPETRLHVNDSFCVATTEPAVAGGTQRLASSADAQVTLALAGYLATEDRQEFTRPAEHCLELYLQHGPPFALALNGSFTLVIHDRRSGQLHLVTDRLGTRPLFYCSGAPFLFASEVKGILDFPGVSRAVNPSPMLIFLVRRCMFGTETYYDHIQRAPEASVTTWDGTAIASARYWQPPFDVEECPDIQENARRTYRALRHAARRACFGVERMGLMLSGGLDSRAVASACPTPPLCLTMHTHEGPEVQTARRVARALDYPHQFVRLPASFPRELVTAGSLIGDGMHSFRHAQGQYLADTLAQHGTQAILTGCCMGAVMGGQPPLPRPRPEGGRGDEPSRRLADRLDVADRICNTELLARLPQVQQLVRRDRLEAAVVHAREVVGALVADMDDGVAPLHRLHEFAAMTNVAGQDSMLNVMNLDRLAAPRTIGCDTEMLDLLFTVPPQQRRGHRLYTTVFTHLDRRCRWIPYSNTGVPVFNSAALERLAILPHRVSRRIQGGIKRLTDPRYDRFHFDNWPDADMQLPEWQRYLRDRVESSRLVDMGLLSGDGLRSLVEALLAGAMEHWLLLARWVTLEEWLAHYG